MDLQGAVYRMGALITTLEGDTYRRLVARAGFLKPCIEALEKIPRIELPSPTGQFCSFCFPATVMSPASGSASVE